jgi:hypothetical protein
MPSFFAEIETYEMERKQKMKRTVKRRYGSEKRDPKGEVNAQI